MAVTADYVKISATSLTKLATDVKAFMLVHPAYIPVGRPFFDAEYGWSQMMYHT